MKAVEAGRRRANGVERAFFSHLVETEALMLQRERLMQPDADEKRADLLEAARTEAHEQMVLSLRRELEANNLWRLPKPRKGVLIGHGHEQGKKGNLAYALRSCWESDSLMHVYRSVSGGTIRRLSSALFGEELLSLTAAKTAAAEKERMLESRAEALFEAQVSLQAEKDKLASYKAVMKAEVCKAQASLSEAIEEKKQRQDMVDDAERVRTSLSRRIISMQVARDELSQTVGDRLERIREAVLRRIGFLPWAVERSVNELVNLCSAAAAPSPTATETESFSSPSSSCQSLCRGDDER